jgi:hypothetical protein
MSYLDSPRLIFSGFFQADVSAIKPQRGARRRDQWPLRRAVIITIVKP